MTRGNNPLGGKREPEPLTMEDLADALVSVMETQEAIMRMLWSVRAGTRGAAFLDDSDFQTLAMKRSIAANTLRAKSMAAKMKGAKT